MLTINLLQDGKEKTYTQEFIPARVFRRTIEVRESIKDGISTEKLDMIAAYVSEVFGGQFTTEQFYDGIPSHKFLDTFRQCANAVSSGVSQAIGEDPDDPNE